MTMAPKRGKTAQRKKNKVLDDSDENELSSTNATASTDMSSVSSVSSTFLSSTINFTFGDMPLSKDYVLNNIAQERSLVEITKQQALDEIDAKYRCLIEGLTEEQRNIQIDLTGEPDELVMEILNQIVGAGDEDDDTGYFAEATCTTVKKARRSRSANRLPAIAEDAKPRSSSVGTCSSTSTSTTVKTAYKTPVHRPRNSHLLSSKKYTVRKPLHIVESAVNVKRLMRAGEEAISTSGSPLYVQGVAVSEPQVNIPLRDGKILNIASKRANANLCVPSLDQVTREKIKILCENLQKCIAK